METTVHASMYASYEFSGSMDQPRLSWTLQSTWWYLPGPDRCTWLCMFLLTDFICFSFQKYCIHGKCWDRYLATFAPEKILVEGICVKMAFWMVYSYTLILDSKKWTPRLRSWHRLTTSSFSVPHQVIETDQLNKPKGRLTWQMALSGATFEYIWNDRMALRRIVLLKETFQPLDELSVFLETHRSWSMDAICSHDEFLVAVNHDVVSIHDIWHGTNRVAGRNSHEIIPCYNWWWQLGIISREAQYRGKGRTNSMPTGRHETSPNLV